MATDAIPPVDLRLLTAPELAAALRITVRGLTKSVGEGRVPRPLKLGRLSRWRADEMAAWLRAGAPPATEWTWPSAAG